MYIYIHMSMNRHVHASLSMYMNTYEFTILTETRIKGPDTEFTDDRQRFLKAYRRHAKTELRFWRNKFQRVRTSSGG